MWIEALKNGKYRAVERYTDPITGKDRKISVTIDKDTNATRKAAAETLRLRIEEAGHVTSAENITLRKLADQYLADQKKTVRLSTYTRNSFAIETILTILGPDSLTSRLTAPYVREKLLDTGKEPGTLNEHLKRFKAMIRWGYRNDLVAEIGYLEKLPNFKDAPHRESIEDKYMEAEELKRVLEAMKHRTWKLLTEFLALSGLRIGEAISLKKADIDFKAKEIHVTKAYDIVNEAVSYPKNSSSFRDVAMQPELEAVCRKIITEMNRNKLRNGISHTGGLFLFDKEGSYIDYYAYNKYLRENTLKTIGRALTPHALRHTHASLLMEQGVPIDIISRRLGHENSKITRKIYLHVTKKLKKKDDETLRAVSLLQA